MTRLSRCWLLLAIVCATVGRPALAEEAAADGRYRWTLDACVQRATDRAPVVRAARERAAMAEARYDEVRWRWLPEVKLTTLFSYAPGQSGDVDENASAVFGNWGPLVRFEIKGEMPLYTFGRLAADDDVARAHYEVARARAADALHDVTLDIQEAWHDQAAARARADVLELGLAELQAIRRHISELEDEDDEDLDPVDALKVRVRISDLQIRLRAERRAERRARAGLRLLLAVDKADADAFAVVDEKPFPVLLELAPIDEVTAMARVFSDDLRAHRLDEQAARHEVRARDRDLYPEFFAAALFRIGYAQASEVQLSPFTDDPGNSWEAALVFGMRVPLDIPQGLSRRSVAEAERDRAGRRRQVRRLQLQLRVTELHGKVADRLRLLPVLRDAAEAARSWFFARKSTFDAGLSSLGVHLSAVSQLVDRQLTLIDAVHDLNVGVATLARHVGVDTRFLAAVRVEGAPPSPEGLRLPGGIRLPDDLPPELRERILRRLGRLR